MPSLNFVHERLLENQTITAEEPFILVKLQVTSQPAGLPFLNDIVIIWCISLEICRYC